MLIYFIRHGETDFNKKRIIQGSGVDSSLNATGRAQARAFYEKYKDVPFDKVITSDLKRTSETVKPFTDAGLEQEKDADINEMNWGVHEGQPGSEAMKVLYQNMIAAWGADDFDHRLEAGESARELADRIQRFLDSLKSRTENTLLVCSHGRAMRCIVALMKEQHLREMENVSHANTGLYLAELKDGKFTVIKENDTEHLQSLTSDI